MEGHCLVILEPLVQRRESLSEQVASLLEGGLVQLIVLEVNYVEKREG